MARPLTVLNTGPRPCANCGQMFTPRNPYVPSACCGHKCAAQRRWQGNTTVERLIGLMEQGHSPVLTDLGTALGITRERVRQIIKQLQADGRWQWPLERVQCVVCGTLESFDADTRSAAIRVKRLYGWRSVRGEWACPVCMKERRKQKALGTWSEDWPREGTVYWKVLQWMESGRAYNIRAIAKEYDIRPVSAVSRAKRKLFDRGKWRWDVDCYRVTYDLTPKEVRPDLLSHDNA